MERERSRQGAGIYSDTFLASSLFSFFLGRSLPFPSPFLEDSREGKGGSEDSQGVRRRQVMVTDLIPRLRVSVPVVRLHDVVSLVTRPFSCLSPGLVGAGLLRSASSIRSFESTPYLPLVGRNHRDMEKGSLETLDGDFEPSPLCASISPCEIVPFSSSFAVCLGPWDLDGAGSVRSSGKARNFRGS